MSEERTCHICGTRTAEFCPVCLAAYEHLPDPETMTGEERRREMDLISGPLEIPFEKLHARHEMTTSNWLSLVAEAENRCHPRLETVLNLVPEEKRIIVTIAEEGGEAG